MTASRILIVDDERFLCSSLARLLRKHGFTVETATSGTAAIALVGAEPTAFAVVLVDLHMPQMGGEETAETLKRIAPHLKIAIMTGVSPDLLPNGMPDIKDVGVADVLLFKPFEQGLIVQTVTALFTPP